MWQGKSLKAVLKYLQVKNKTKYSTQYQFEEIIPDIIEEIISFILGHPNFEVLTFDYFPSQG